MHAARRRAFKLVRLATFAVSLSLPFFFTVQYMISGSPDRQTMAATSVLEHTAKNYMAFYVIQSLLTLTHSAGASVLLRATRFRF